MVDSGKFSALTQMPYRNYLLQRQFWAITMTVNSQKFGSNSMKSKIQNICNQSIQKRFIFIKIKASLIRLKRIWID